MCCRLTSSDIIQSACVTAIRPELPFLIGIARRPLLLITCSVFSATADYTKYGNFLRKKRVIPLTEMSKKDQNSVYFILMKQKPNLPAGFSAQNASSKNIPNCNLNELFVS